jgi:hypothetical protein
MGDKLTFADLRARIAARGLDSKIVVVGGEAVDLEPLGLTAAELESWLDGVAGRSDRVRIRIRRTADVAWWRLALERLLNPTALRFDGQAGWRRRTDD